MKNLILTLFCTLFLFFPGMGFPYLMAQKADFTEQDKETIKETRANTEELKNRMTRVETKLEETEKRLDAKIDSLDKRFDSLQNLSYIIIGGIFGLIGFVVWDRASSNAPLRKRQDVVEEKETKLEKALQDFARKNNEMAESLKNVGL
jgi:DNA repair exonuclease SbcCD ATPase subunit